MIQTILHLSLVVHIIAISMVVGITIANFVAFKQFWKLYAVNHEQGLSAFRAITNFQFIGMIGLLLLIRVRRKISTSNTAPHPGKGILTAPCASFLQLDVFRSPMISACASFPSSGWCSHSRPICLTWLAFIE